MPKYYVYSSETVFYATEVEAKDEEEAIKKVRYCEVDTGEPIDGENFDVTGAELVEDAENRFEVVDDIIVEKKEK